MFASAQSVSGRRWMMVHNVDRQHFGKDAAMWTRTAMMILPTGVAAIAFGCSQHPSVASVETAEKVDVTPGSVNIEAGIMTGQVIDMKVTKQIEKASGNVVSEEGHGGAHAD
jgi:hypothetical protein